MNPSLQFLLALAIVIVAARGAHYVSILDLVAIELQCLAHSQPKLGKDPDRR